MDGLRCLLGGGGIGPHVVRVIGLKLRVAVQAAHKRVLKSRGLHQGLGGVVEHVGRNAVYLQVPARFVPALHELIARKMERRAVTVAALAEMTGVNARTITALRSGKSEGNMATWRVIARRLGCTIDEIVG